MKKYADISDLFSDAKDFVSPESFKNPETTAEHVRNSALMGAGIGGVGGLGLNLGGSMWRGEFPTLWSLLKALITGGVVGGGAGGLLKYLSMQGGNPSGKLGPNVDSSGQNKWDRAGLPTPGGAVKGAFVKEANPMRFLRMLIGGRASAGRGFARGSPRAIGLAGLGGAAAIGGGRRGQEGGGQAARNNMWSTLAGGTQGAGGGYYGRRGRSTPRIQSPLEKRLKIDLGEGVGVSDINNTSTSVAKNQPGQGTRKKNKGE